MRTGEVIADRFAIQQLLGSGGMGSVFQAYDRVTARLVAVKVLDLASEAGYERFIREARVLADLSHPAIVRYVAHGESQSRRPFLAMELLEGEDLGQRLGRGALSPVESLGVVRRAAEALAFAHANGIVHRDVKPSNLFLVGGDILRLKVLDFGIARERLHTRGPTQSGVMLGTVGYMAPEQVTGAAAVDAAADVFALGCVLFECLTGQPAFAGRHAIAVLAKVMSAETPKVSDVRPDLGTGFDELVARMLAKDPARRFRDAAELVPELTLLLEQTPDGVPRPSSPPPSVSHREQRIVSVLLAEGLPEGSWGEESPEMMSVRGATERTGVVVTPLRGGSLLVMVSGRGGAHDQAMEAARCALSLGRIVPGLRLALATGRIEGDARHAVGAPIDRAAALLRTKEADEVKGALLDDVTAGLLGSRFEIERGGPLPVLVGELDDIRETRLFLGKPTPTVGRDRELAICELTLTECIEEGVARSIIVTAPPGVGKSRLLSEFGSRERDSGRVSILVATASPAAMGASLALAGLLVRRAVGLVAGQSQSAQEQALRSHAATALPRVDGPTLEFLGEIAGVSMDASRSPLLRAARNDPSIMQEQRRRAFEAWIDGVTSGGPLLILLEDLHWGDAPSIGFLEDALTRLCERPLMVLATARPEVHERFPKLFRRAGAQELRLGGLTRRAAERLVRAVLGDDAEPQVVARVVERADGNVFYLEELMRRVTEGSGTLPHSVLAMAESRLERLETEARRVLRAASVYGEACSQGAVAALVDPSVDTAGWLEALVGRELLSRLPESRHAGERQYRFRHALLRDAAYAMLPEQDRRNAHALAGQWLEAHGEKEPLVIAEHYEAGGDNGRAVHWLCAAARVAVDSGDMLQAVAMARRGRALGASGEELGLLAALEGLAVMWTNRAPITLLREAIELLPHGGPLWWSAVVGEAIYKVVASESPSDAPEFIQQVFGPPPRELTGPYGMAVCGVIVGLLGLGQSGAAHAFLGQFDGIAAADESVDPLFSAWLDLARSWKDFASTDGGVWRLEQSFLLALGVAERMSACGALLGEATARYYAALGATWLGLYEQAERLSSSALSFAARPGAELLRMYVRLAIVGLRLRQGRLDEAQAMLEALEPTVDASQVQLKNYLWAEAYLGAGRPEEARARAAAATTGPVVSVVECAWMVAARAELALGRFDEALRITERVPTSVAVADRDLLTTRALALRSLGRDIEARDAMREAQRTLHTIAEAISDLGTRHAFLTRVPENVRVAVHARQILGED